MISRNISIVFFIAILLMSIGCFKDQDEIIPELPGNTLDGNGLTKDITDLVPEYIIEEMINQGMPLYGGGNPPEVEGEYLGSPFVLISSNRPSDVLGYVFPDFFLTFSDQNNDDLKVMVDYVNGPEEGTGIGSFLVGEGSKFSIFVKLDITHTGGTRAIAIYVISGEITEFGIRGMHLPNFMIDDMGDAQGVWIENGEGRVIYDTDGFSEKIGVTPEWYYSLPDCPCEYSPLLDGVEELGGEWADLTDGCFGVSFLEDFHLGAKYELRWVGDQITQGQQCTYDINKHLITNGIGAGTPDRFGVDNPCIPNLDHNEADVEPWKEISCFTYLREWKPNEGKDCNDNIVIGIDHLQAMVGDMSCEGITEIFKMIFSSDNATSELIDFMNGQLNFTPVNLKIDLQQVFVEYDCSNSLDDLNCAALNEAINNL